MHDFHEADKMVKLILKYADKNKLKKVTHIKIKLGKIIEHNEQINPENFKFNIKMLLKKTIAENAKIDIIRTRGGKVILSEIEGIK